MANVFKNYQATCSASDATLYTVPSGTTSIVIGLSCANKVTSTHNVTLKLGSKFVANEMKIPNNSTLHPLPAKMVLEAGETFVIKADAAAKIDVILSVMEQS